MFGVNGYEFMILLLVAVIVIGPTRLPKYAEELAKLTKAARRQLRDLKQQVNEETNKELEDIDWKTLDPRQYDPRRIVRQALVEDQAQQRRLAQTAALSPMPRPAPGTPAPQGPAPFDVEAT